MFFKYGNPIMAITLGGPLWVLVKLKHHYVSNSESGIFWDQKLNLAIFLHCILLFVDSLLILKDNPDSNLVIGWELNLIEFCFVIL